MLDCGAAIPTFLFQHYVNEWDEEEEILRRRVWVPPCPKHCDGGCKVTTVGSFTRERCWDEWIPFKSKFKVYGCSAHSQRWSILSDHVQGVVAALGEEDEPTAVHMHPFPFVTSGRSIVSERFFNSMVTDNMKGRMALKDITRRARERWLRECVRRADDALAGVEVLPPDRRAAVHAAVEKLVEWQGGWDGIGNFGSNLVRSLMRAWWESIGEKVEAHQRVLDERGAGKRLSGDHTYRIGESYCPHCPHCHHCHHCLHCSHYPVTVHSVPLPLLQ